jgi:hypothetical protein
VNKVEIKLTEAVNLSLLEIDDRLPSMKFSIDIEIEKISSVIKYASQSVWVAVEDWKTWIDRVKKIDSYKYATLVTLDKDLTIKISKSKNDFSCLIQCLNDSISKPVFNLEISDFVDQKNMADLLEYNEELSFMI